MSLGVKQLSKDPWSDDKLLKKYSVGSVHKGLVRNLNQFWIIFRIRRRN